MEFASLMKYERRCLSLKILAPVATVTWFDGDHQRAHQQIEFRMKEIIRMNPWLLGSFQKKEGKMCIAYHSKVSEPPPTVCTNGSLLVHVQEPEKDVEYGMKNFFPTGSKVRLTLEHKKDTNQPLWKVSIIPCARSPDERFGVFVSMSHILGDGHSFYRLYNMLICGETISKLNIFRPKGFEKMFLDSMGRDGVRGMASPKILQLIGVGAVSKLLFRTSVQSRTFLVEMNKMTEMKEAQKDDCPFVSSNDIITSWFATQTKCSYALIPVNMRKNSQTTGCTEDQVGNMLTILYLKSFIDHSISPSHVRKHVNDMRNSTAIPWRIVTKRVSMVTNWASFPSKNTALEGCKELLHMPATDFAADQPPNFSAAVVFRARPGQLGITIVGSSDYIVKSAPFESVL